MAIRAPDGANKKNLFLDKICHPAFENVIAGVVAWVGGSIAYLVHEERRSWQEVQ